QYTHTGPAFFGILTSGLYADGERVFQGFAGDQGQGFSDQALDQPELERAWPALAAQAQWLLVGTIPLATAASAASLRWAVDQAKAAVANKEKAKEFFALLASQEGVQKDPSGFFYEILQKGKGATPTMEDTVRLHYHGTLIDGTVFDSSVDRGQPASFPMNGVIKGFSGGLTKTQVGGKIRIYIPSELGYGDNPRPGGKIKPGDTLIFECELLEIL
ncbi:MAG: FKBP-type peptidyl-prolyl cis-trans isomerase, partial [Opitutae bacterium]|nr:FKBP-type peptidyl-prolyl cis-trans isomerase [Opitutae bacterium]